MIEAFERHLDAALFQRKLEECCTIGDQVKFCREFLLKYEAPKPPPLQMDPQQFMKVMAEDYNSVPRTSKYGEIHWVQSQYICTQDMFPLDAFSLRPSTSFETETLPPNWISEELNSMLMSELSKKSFVKYGSYLKHEDHSRVFTAKMGVCKP
jgi:hypothetical protein